MLNAFQLASRILDHLEVDIYTVSVGNIKVSEVNKRNIFFLEKVWENLKETYNDEHNKIY